MVINKSKERSRVCPSPVNTEIPFETRTQTKRSAGNSAADAVIIDLEGDIDIVHLGRGGCRGKGWNDDDKWPKNRGQLTVRDCGKVCVATKGCTGFQSSSKKPADVSDCLIFAHKALEPSGDESLGDCYKVALSAGSRVTLKTRDDGGGKKKHKIPKFDPPRVVDDVDDPDEDEWLFEPPPPEIRSREHIGAILGLGDKPNSGMASLTDDTLAALKSVYETAIRPLETAFKYREFSHRHFGDPEMFNKPLIVLMGPWSGGKSSMINYLLGTEYTKNAFKAAAEPSPGFNFNIAMHGEREEDLEGTELVAEWSLSSLQKFGQEFLKKLRGKKMPNKLLERATFAEIPGVMETGSRRVDRQYNFNDACQWFIDHADLILLVYDYAKLDIGPETEALLDQLKGRETQVRIILNKADEITAEELLKIQSNLVWNVSPLMASLEPPTLYAGSFWSRPYQEGAPKKLLKAQELALLADIRTAIDRRVENRIATARRFAVRVRNHAKMVDCYLTTYHNQKTFFGDKKVTSKLIVDHPERFHIYDALSSMNANISRYDLPDPQTYRTFFSVNPLYEFPTLQSTCAFFRGCPVNKLDAAIAYDLPELMTSYRRKAEDMKSKKKDK